MMLRAPPGGALNRVKEALTCLDTSHCWTTGGSGYCADNNCDPEVYGGNSRVGKWDGAGWTLKKLPQATYTSNEPHGIAFVDPKRGFVVGEPPCCDEFGVMYTSTDGGNSWTQTPPPGGTGQLITVNAFDVCHAWSVGQTGTIIAYTDSITCPPPPTGGQGSVVAPPKVLAKAGAVAADGALPWPVPAGVTLVLALLGGYLCSRTPLLGRMRVRNKGGT
jgi:hypothetical protein